MILFNVFFYLNIYVVYILETVDDGGMSADIVSSCSFAVFVKFMLSLGIILYDCIYMFFRLSPFMKICTKKKHRGQSAISYTEVCLSLIKK